MLDRKYMNMLSAAKISVVFTCEDPASLTIALSLRRGEWGFTFSEPALDWHATFYQETRVTSEGEKVVAMAKIEPPHRPDEEKIPWSGRQAFEGTAEDVVRSVIATIVAADPGQTRIPIRSYVHVFRKVGIEILQEHIGPRCVQFTLRRCAPFCEIPQSSALQDWKIDLFDEGERYSAKVKRPTTLDDDVLSLQWDDLPVVRGSLDEVVEQITAMVMNKGAHAQA